MAPVAASEPDFHSPPRHNHGVPDAYSAAPGDAHNRAAQAGHAAAHHAEADQHLNLSKAKSKRVPDENIARLVAEENASRSKFPRYPGLERWELVEKMGDGAFSNVYRARDLEGKHGEVAIKVVRKFEMNNQQVREGCPGLAALPLALPRFLGGRCRVFVLPRSLLPTPGLVLEQQASSPGFQAKGSQGCRGARISFLCRTSYRDCVGCAAIGCPCEVDRRCHPHASAGARGEPYLLIGVR